MDGLFNELKRRNVFRVGIAYLALAWLVIEVTGAAVPALGLQDSLNGIVFFLGLIGFPFALFFAWAFELTPEGLKRSHEVAEEDSVRGATARKIEHLIVGLLAASLAFVLWQGYGDQSGEVAPPQAPPGNVGKSIAVLPFVNISDDKDYFADGLSEELLNLLAKNRNLKVAGRTSSFAFKGKNSDLRGIGEALDVATILEGSVRRSGDRIRITAQLINVADGYHLWSETYDRNMADIFDIQDEVARAITEALQVTLGGEDGPARVRPTDNLDAYNAYLEGLSFQGFDLKTYRLALSRFEEAIAHDPTFINAWVARAHTAYVMIVNENRAQSESLARARAYVLDAVALDPNRPYVRALETATRDVDDYDWYEDMVANDAAMAADPTDLRPYGNLFWSLVEAGYRVEALELADHMIGLEPLARLAIMRHGEALYANGQTDAARQQMEKAVILGVEEASYFYFVDRLLDNDPEGAIAVFSAIEQAGSKDLSAIRTLVKADFRGDALDAELAATVDVGVSIIPLLNLGRGRLDAFMDELLAGRLDEAYNPADTLALVAMAFPQSGFTTHPRFLEFAEGLGMTGVWDKRGPPDMCSKETGDWVCE